MTIVKTEVKEATKVVSPMKKAVKYMKEYRELSAQQAEIVKRKKELEEALFEMAEANRGIWFQGSNTCHLEEEGKLSYLNETQLIIDLEGYDEKAFARAFPECVEIKPKASVIKGLCVNADVRDDIELHGISIGTREKFQVTPTKGFPLNAAK